ncbi:MAG: 4-hydroxy-3-methylbut-2-enyl diphosphate reductase [Cellulosilyticaceae bacterium]
MKVIIAETAGFCFGVKRAVNLAFQTESIGRTYTLGPIIHNDTVIDELKEKGISPIEQVGDEQIDTLIIRAHGVTPDVYEVAKQKQITIVDATCPYVTKIHKLVARYANQGYEVILVGDAKHPEIIGIDGWAAGGCHIAKNLEEMKSWELDLNKKYLLVSQTTYKKAVVDEMITYLEAGNYDVKFINTICSATDERQSEAAKVAREVDAMVVIGSQYSSNTQKLFEICKSYCKTTVCISTAKELMPEMVAGAQVVGVTAGASTPDNVIQEVIETLERW